MLLVSSGAIADIARELDPARSGPSFAALGLAASASWIVARDWPRRTYYAIAALCGIAGAILAVTTHDYLHAYTLVGVGLVASGLCDHYLLAHSMRRAQAGDAANVSTRRTAVSGWRRAWFGFVLALTGAIHLAASDTWMAAFPLTLMLALLAAVVVPATFDSLHAVRDFHRGRRPAPNESILECSDRELLAYGALAVAAAFQIGLLWPSRPFLVALAIVVASVGLAVTTPRGRIVHAVRAFTVAIALIWFFTLSPARAFLALVCALAIPVMIEGIMQLWMPVHREPDHADTI